MDFHSRINTHLNTPGKSHLTPHIVWEKDLTLYEMMGLEQALMDLFGGPRSDSCQTPLLNEVRFSPGKDASSPGPDPPGR